MPIPRVSIAAIRSRCLFSLIALVFSILSATSVVAQQAFQFDRFAVEGNQRIEPDTIIALAGIPAGQQVSAGQVNDGLQRILASGF